MAELTERVDAWRRRGAEAECRDRRIHVLHEQGSDPLLLFLHGFPSSSYDWAPLLEQGIDRELLMFDFLGFGLSEKPRGIAYSLLWQADLAEELVRRAGGSRAFIVAHDMGTSVANELMAREIEGSLSFGIAGVLLLNGSMVQGAASPTLGQRLLRGRLGPLAARLASERFFRDQFGSIFSPAHPLTDEEAADQWCLIRRGGGHRLGHKLIGYMDERFENAERWHGAIRDWEGPLSLAWGMLDPVATPVVLEAVRELRPAAPLRCWEELGHYPQIEDPAAVARALRDAT
ncbi:MAG: alpha/beta fold hydrolase [Solirubrobacterales bacterium]